MHGQRHHHHRTQRNITVPPDIGQQFAHQAGSFVLALHLFDLKVFQEIRDHGIQWDGKNHDGDPNERGPSEKVIQRDEREGDLCTKCRILGVNNICRERDTLSVTWNGAEIAMSPYVHRSCSLEASTDIRLTISPVVFPRSSLDKTRAF